VSGPGYWAGVALAFVIIAGLVAVLVIFALA
jgi:hypothetical protein